MTKEGINAFFDILNMDIEEGINNKVVIHTSNETIYTTEDYLYELNYDYEKEGDEDKLNSYEYLHFIVIDIVGNITGMIYIDINSIQSIKFEYTINVKSND